jgi:hypothetical protein
MKSFKDYIVKNEEESYQLNSGMIAKKSSIHGWGIFAPNDYKKGEFMYNLIIPCEESENCRTEACRLTNHSKDSNIHLQRDGDKLIAIANQDIPKHTECTINYLHVYPKLIEGNPIGAGSVYRETKNVDHLFPDDTHYNLHDAIDDIENGKYK